VRAASRSRIVELLVDIKVLAQSVVEATGDGFEFDVSDIFDDMIVSRLIARRMKTYADNLGFRLDKIVKMPYGEPTEWGIVSYDTSTFQGFYPITTSDVELGEPAFAEASDTDEAYEQTFRVAECMSFAALDILRDVDFRAMIDNQLVKALHARGVERLHRRWTGLHRVLPGSDERGAKRGPALLDFKIVQGPDTEPTDEPST
jgi:hypothetical protein